MPLDGPPTMTRDLWLAESLSTSDVVVWGSGDGAVWRIEEVLCGELSPEVPRLALGNDASERGVRFLVRTNRGYFDVGPVDRPATRREWDALSRRARPRDPLELEVEENDHEVARYAQVGGQRVRYGVAASAGADHVSVTLADGRNAALATRVFRAGGRVTSWERRPAAGRGFRMRRWADGSIQGWEHYLDGRAHGVRRSHFPDGQIEYEITFHNGVRHGTSRRFDEDGTPTSHETFEQGLIPPITRPHSEATAARLHADEWTFYSGPDELIRRVRVGMTVQQVADELGLPVSAAMGVSFPGEPCVRNGTYIRFEDGRVLSRESTVPEGGCLGL